MAKKKKKRQNRSSTGQTKSSPQAKLSNDLSRAESLVQRKRLNEAHDMLREMNRRYPDHWDVLSMLANIALERKDITHYQQYVEQLLKLEPDDPDLTLALAGSYLENARFALSLRTFRRFLKGWPDHPRAADAQQTTNKLDTELAHVLPEYGLSGDDALDLAAQHEQILVRLEQGDFAGARRKAETFLQRKPEFTPVLNNLSQAHYVEGNVEQAIAASQRVLEIDPENYHALSNLTRYHCLFGRVEEAHEWAARLKAIVNDEASEDLATKQAEALSYLGDDQGVLAAFQAAERQGITARGTNVVLLYHLAAVATMRQGDEAGARRLWKESQTAGSWFRPARDNLKDLRKPVGERHAPWPFELPEWINEGRIRSLTAMVERLAKTKEGDSTRALTSQVQKWLKEQPEMVKLVPMLLDRGSPSGREFALRLATAAEMPELNEALRDFALSQRGPDTDRNRAAAAAREAGLIPAGMVTMWLQGEWREVMLLGFEIYDEPEHAHKPRTAELAAEATLALRERRVDEALELLQQALELEPDAPDLKNNVAVAYSLKGDRERSEAMAHEIHEQYPDYFFAAVSVARLHIRDGELDKAKALLEPLLMRTRMHTSEFSSLCEAEIEYWMAKGEQGGAQSWLKLWEDVDPDNTHLARWQMKLKTPRLLQKLLNRR